MARVIKGTGDNAKVPARRPSARFGGASGRRVIEKEVFRAQQEAADLHAWAERERERVLAEGKALAARAREEAQVGGAEEAFAVAAEETLRAFRRRAERYAEAADDIDLLAREVVKKILGTELGLPGDQARALLLQGIARLRARRRLRVQVAPARLTELERERPGLLAALEREPDLVLEAQPDVSPGFARVVTEVGGALCAEKTALDRLAESIAVQEPAPEDLPGLLPAPPAQSSAHAPEADVDHEEREDEPDKVPTARTPRVQPLSPRVAPLRGGALPMGPTAGTRRVAALPVEETPARRSPAPRATPATARVRALDEGPAPGAFPSRMDRTQTGHSHGEHSHGEHGHGEHGHGEHSHAEHSHAEHSHAEHSHANQSQLDRPERSMRDANARAALPSRGFAAAHEPARVQRLSQPPRQISDAGQAPIDDDLDLFADDDL